MRQRHEKTVLFLCTGNYYRSRFAEALFNSVAGKLGLPWKASSRGLALERGVNNVGPMEGSAVTALEALGVHSDDGGQQPPNGKSSPLGWAGSRTTLFRRCPMNKNGHGDKDD